MVLLASSTFWSFSMNSVFGLEKACEKLTDFSLQNFWSFIFNSDSSWQVLGQLTLSIVRFPCPERRHQGARPLRCSRTGFVFSMKFLHPFRWLLCNHRVHDLFTWKLVLAIDDYFVFTEFMIFLLNWSGDRKSISFKILKESRLVGQFT